jgi:hypothetical protein
MQERQSPRRLEDLTLEQDWEHYVKDMALEGAPLGAQNAIKNSFFAGAWTVLCYFQAFEQADQSTQGAEVCAQFLSNRMAECLERLRLIQAGLA